MHCSPMKVLLGNDSFTSFDNNILSGKADFNNTSLNDVQQHFSILKYPSYYCEDLAIPPKISIQQMFTGFQKWKEKTSTSPSTRLLSHYKCLLIPEKNNSEIALFNQHMLLIHNTIINACLYKAILSKR